MLKSTLGISYDISGNALIHSSLSSIPNSPLLEHEAPTSCTPYTAAAVDNIKIL